VTGRCNADFKFRKIFEKEKATQQREGKGFTSDEKKSRGGRFFLSGRAGG